MNTRLLYETRCRCNEKISITKKRKKRKPKKRRYQSLIPYPDETKMKLETFQIRYEKKLSSVTKLVLKSFQKKYIYYAIDDILYSFKLNKSERDNLLAILYSPVISLQNNFSINFLDIWINEIEIKEVSKVNKFLNDDSSNFEQRSCITIKLSYKTPIPFKKPDSLW